MLVFYLSACTRLVVGMVVGGRRGRKGNLIPDWLRERVERFAVEQGIGFDEAVARLIEKGLRFYELEKKGEAGLREVWDRRHYFWSIEAGYLYYRLRLREVLEELKSLAMVLTGVVGMARSCFESCGLHGGLDDLKAYEEAAKRVVEEYVVSTRREIEEKKYASDLEVLKSVLEYAERYARELGVKVKCTISVDESGRDGKA